MSTTIPFRHRMGNLHGDRMPNMTGLVLCTLLALPIWAGILALVL